MWLGVPILQMGKLKHGSRIAGLESPCRGVRLDADSACAPSHRPAWPLGVTGLVIWGGWVRRQQSPGYYCTGGLCHTGVTDCTGCSGDLCPCRVSAAGPEQARSGGGRTKRHCRGKRTGGSESCVFPFRSDRDSLDMPSDVHLTFSVPLLVREQIQLCPPDPAFPAAW